MRAFARRLEAGEINLEQLGREDAGGLRIAVDWAVRFIDEIRREARAWCAAMDAPGSERALAYANARGLPLPTKDERKTKRHPPMVLATYLTVLGVLDPADTTTVAMGEPWWVTTADPDQPFRTVKTKDATPAEAMAITAWQWDYPTTAACRGAIVRWKSQIKRSPKTGWHAHFPTDFPIPSNR